MNIQSPLIIYFFTVCGVATIFTLCVILQIIRKKSWSNPRNFLVFIQHVAFLGQYIAFLPLLYVDNECVCRAMGALHYYFGLAHVVDLLLLTVYVVRGSLFSNKANVIEKFIIKLSSPIIVLFPTITFLPFITNSYGVLNNLWCTLPLVDKIANFWSIVIYYGWMVLVLVITTILIGFGLWKAITREDDTLRRYSAVCVYIIFSIIAWIPRLIPRVSSYVDKLQWGNSELLIFNSFLYWSGIVAALLFVVIESETMERDENTTLRDRSAERQTTLDNSPYVSSPFDTPEGSGDDKMITTIPDLEAN